MKEKDRKKVQALLHDAREKADKGNGEHPKEYYAGIVRALEFVLTEV